MNVILAKCPYSERFLALYQSFGFFSFIAVSQILGFLTTLCALLYQDLVLLHSQGGFRWLWLIVRGIHTSLCSLGHRFQLLSMCFSPESSLCCSSHSSTITFTCVQGKDLKESIVWEASVSGPKKSNILSNTC